MDQHYYSSSIMASSFLVNGYFSALVGWLSDKHSNFILCLWEENPCKTVYLHIYIFFCRKFGQRKSWHLVGLVCTLVSFPFIFQPCIISAEAQAIYYAVLAVVYCFGWASQQVNKSGDTWHNDKYFMYIDMSPFSDTQHDCLSEWEDRFGLDQVTISLLIYEALMCLNQDKT